MIDIHSHIYPLSYLDYLERRERPPRVLNKGDRREFIIFPAEDGPDGDGGREMGPEFWEIDEKLAFMDEFGIDRTVVSLGNPWFDPFTEHDSLEWARRVNEELASYDARTKGRVVGLAALPAVDIDSVLTEVDWIADKSGLCGLVSGTRVAGHRFDDPALNPFWEQITSLGLPLFLHPSRAAELAELVGYQHTLPVGVGFPVETTIALSRLIFGGVLERYPQLKLLAAHGGGCLPYLSGRLDAAWRSEPEVQTHLRRPPSEQIPSLYLDALVYAEHALAAARACVGEQHLLFGTDHPFSVADPRRSIEIVERSPTEDARARVFQRNAEELFGLESR